MMAQLRHLKPVVDRARALDPIRVAVVGAEQQVVIETLREACELGFVEPRLIGQAEALAAASDAVGWRPRPEWVVPANSAEAAASIAVEMVRGGTVDTIMKGNIHTDALMHALLDPENGLRVAGRRVSHMFLVDVPARTKLLGITDAAINIAPDLVGKAQILQNAIDVFHVLGVETPKVAVLSAVETVTPSIVSTLDAACLTLMARRGQITGAVVDGPLAFDNAISLKAAQEKGITSSVAGDADILLVPDLVSGNILAKTLEYLAGAVAAGVTTGLAVPVVLASRADPVPARIASLALAALMHHRLPKVTFAEQVSEPALLRTPQPEHACCPVAQTTHRSGLI